MEEFYGNDVELASPVRWQREIESRTFHSPEMLNNLEIVSRFHGIDVKEYIVYGAASRSLHSSSVHIPDAIVMQRTDREQHECGYYTYIAVPESLDRETIERYELSFVSRPASN